MRAVAKLIATFGPVGYFPIAPATAGSAVVAGIGWWIAPPSALVTGGCLLLGTAVAIWAAGEAEKDLGHDAKPIVADEAVGQSIALLGVPHALWAFAAAFVLFRIFDIWKPLGAHQAQKLSGGYGIVADDVIAGITSCAVFHLGWWGLRQAGIAIG